MTATYDVAVVGAGPAGSSAALVLARAGARVALLDKASFPRDKACGDLLGPRGVRLLTDLDVKVRDAGSGSDMLVQGPSGGRLRLPAYPGLTYADHGVIVPRTRFDADLREAALEAGAEPIIGRVTRVSGNVADRPVELDTSAGRRITAALVVGADGALSTVGKSCGLVDDGNVLWGFALRGYVTADVPIPLIALLDQRPGVIFPGYGWLFPGDAGCANVGIGVGTGHGRNVPPLRPALAAFVDRLRTTGDLETAEVGRLTGGWLKMGLVGTVPARNRVLLVGDAAGLVNPLQGEGIAPAITSGVLAARAILDAPAAAAEVYRAALSDTYRRFAAFAAPLQATLLNHPRLTSVGVRALTTRPLRFVGGTWSLLWNDLVDGATPRPARTAARILTSAAARVSARSVSAQILERSLR